MLSCTINTNEFQEVLKKLNKIKVKSGTPKVLQGIEMRSNNQKLELIKATHEKNNINYITATIYDADIHTEGSVMLINTKEIEKSFKFMKDPKTHIEIKNNQALIKNSNKEIKIDVITDENLIKIPKLDTLNSYKYNSKDLYRRLKKVSFARSKNDDTRPTLTGIVLNKTDIVALDGFRLVVTKDNNLNIDEKIVLNAEVVDFLLKILDKRNEQEISLHILSEEHVKIEYENISIISKLICGTVFNYEDVIVDSFNEEVKVSTKALKESIDFLSLYQIKGETPIVTMKSSDSKINFIVNNENGIFTSYIDIDKNTQMEISFNNKFMQDALKHIESETIEICYNGTLNPLFLKDHKDIFLILPVRMKSK